MQPQSVEWLPAVARPLENTMIFQTKKIILTLTNTHTQKNDFFFLSTVKNKKVEIIFFGISIFRAGASIL